MQRSKTVGAVGRLGREHRPLVECRPLICPGTARPALSDDARSKPAGRSSPFSSHSRQGRARRYRKDRGRDRRCTTLARHTALL
jgi:hypothetical protein